MSVVQTTTTYRCPACGATLRYDGPSGQMVCDWCGSRFSPEEIERITAERQAKADRKAEEQRAQEEREAAERAAGGKHARSGGAAADDVAGAWGEGAAGVPVPPAPPAPEAPRARKKAAQPAVDPIQEYLKRSNWDDEESANLRTYVCETCAAALIVDQTTAVTRCPYCGNNTVIPGQLSGALKPDYVIPFIKTKDDAVSALTTYYKGKRFLPREFTSQNHLQEVQGVYVPFWLYSSEAHGDAAFDAHIITHWSTGNRDYTKTDTYKATRSGSMAFTRVPVDGSTKMPDAHMDAIEPYDYDALRPFSVAYLPGFLTERYDQDAEACRDRARGRMEESLRSGLRDTVTGYTTVDEGTCDATIDWKGIAYALMPVWMLHTRWNNEDFLFAMNGQTGKIIGDLPIDKKKVVLRFLLYFIPAAIICGAIAFMMA